jgi:hypothetical protein
VPSPSETLFWRTSRPWLPVRLSSRMTPDPRRFLASPRTAKSSRCTSQSTTAGTRKPTTPGRAKWLLASYSLAQGMARRRPGSIVCCSTRLVSSTKTLRRRKSFWKRSAHASTWLGLFIDGWRKGTKPGETPWRQTTSPQRRISRPSPRYSPAFISIGKRIYLFSGARSATEYGTWINGDLYVYDVAENAFIEPRSGTTW